MEVIPYTIKKTLISMVSNFRGSMNMTYWRILVFEVMIYHDSKENRGESNGCLNV